MMVACLQTILHLTPRGSGERLLQTDGWPTMLIVLQLEGKDKQSWPRGITLHGRDGRVPARLYTDFGWEFGDVNQVCALRDLLGK